MELVLGILACAQLVVAIGWVWLMARQNALQRDLVELRTRITSMPTHQDHNELSVELAGVKANTEQTLRLVNTIHNALMDSRP